MVTDLSDTYKMMMMITMVMMMKTQNGHNSAILKHKASRFFMLIDLNDIYGMMIIMMMMITQITITRPVLKVQHPDLAW